MTSSVRAAALPTPTPGGLDDLLDSPVMEPTPTQEVPPSPQQRMTPTPTFTSTWTPTKTATPTKTVTPTVTPKGTRTPVKPSLPRITVIPNPARGTKVTFRITTSYPVKVRMKVYNRFLDTAVILEGEGDHLFDILWSLKDVPEGPYSFQTQVLDKTTGEFTTLPLQKFTVEKDESPPDN